MDSELILNSDGTVFHLHLLPEMVADDILLVGDPARAGMISDRFDTVECTASNREFRTFTGTVGRKRVTVMSTGIGVGNIDIAVNELMIMASLDLSTHRRLERPRHLNLLRLGTCGAVADDLMIGDYAASEYSVGTDSLAFFYRGTESVRVPELERSLACALEWGDGMPPMYAVKNDERLLSMFDGFARRVITLSAVGFYAPQGRNVLLEPWRKDLVGSLGRFSYEGLRVGNIEMEGAPIAMLASLAGMSAATVCAVIAQRVDRGGNPEYGVIIAKLVDYALEKISK